MSILYKYHKAPPRSPNIAKSDDLFLSGCGAHPWQESGCGMVHALESFLMHGSRLNM
jgi:hypothetical protein